MATILITPPDEDSILDMLSVATMKMSLRISYSKEDALIKSAILEAYDWLAGEKGWLNRPVISSTYQITADAFGTLSLPVPSVNAIGSVKYYTGGVLTTLNPSIYSLQKNALYGYGNLLLASGQAWPTALDSVADPIVVEFTAGMGSGEEVAARYPALVKALKLLAGDYFRNREDTFTDIRVVEIDRTIVNDVERVAGRYRFYDDIA